MAFRLQRDRAAGEHLALLLDQLFGVRVPLVELRLGVGEDWLAIHEVVDELIAVALHSPANPRMAVVGFRRGINAVWCKNLPIHDGVGAGLAEIGDRPRLTSPP